MSCWVSKASIWQSINQVINLNQNVIYMESSTEIWAKTPGLSPWHLLGMGCVSFSLNENQYWSFLHWHWACSKKKVEHIIEHMKTSKLKLLGLVLYVSMSVGLALLNCCNFHQVKVLDKFYRRLLNAEGSGHKYFWQIEELWKIFFSHTFMFSEPYKQLQNQMVEHSGIISQCGLN